MTTRDEALDALMICVAKELGAVSHRCSALIVDKLIAYGIHPNAIKVAFTTEVKKDVDQGDNT